MNNRSKGFGHTPRPPFEKQRRGCGQARECVADAALDQLCHQNADVGRARATSPMVHYCRAGGARHLVSPSGLCGWLPTAFRTISKLSYAEMVDPTRVLKPERKGPACCPSHTLREPIVEQLTDPRSVAILHGIFRLGAGSATAYREATGGGAGGGRAAHGPSRPRRYA